MNQKLEWNMKLRIKLMFLYPSKFPFDITHISGDVNKDVLMLRYRNADLGGLLQIKIVPHNADVETLKGENDKFYSLKMELMHFINRISQLLLNLFSGMEI